MAVTQRHPRRLVVSGMDESGIWGGKRVEDKCSILVWLGNENEQASSAVPTITGRFGLNLEKRKLEDDDGGGGCVASL